MSVILDATILSMNRQATDPWTLLCQSCGRSLGRYEISYGAAGTGVLGKPQKAQITLWPRRLPNRMEDIGFRVPASQRPRLFFMEEDGGWDPGPDMWGSSTYVKYRWRCGCGQETVRSSTSLPLLFEDARQRSIVV